MLGAALLAVSACSQPKEAQFEDACFRALPSYGWRYGDTLAFDAPMRFDTRGSSRIAVGVRHSSAYLYSNLWLEIATPLGSDSMRIDTVNIPLADVYGKWLGRGNNTSYVLSDTLAGFYEYDSIRPARVRHIMRLDTLQHVEQVGLVYFDPH